MIATVSRARLRLTVVDARRAEGADLLLDVPAGTRFGDVRPDLTTGVGRAVPQRFRTDAGPVPDDAVIGRPPLLDGTVLVADGGPSPSAGASLVEVHVVAGPRAGDRFGLAVGRHVVGRGPDAAVRVEDADTSRAHAVLVIGSDGVQVADLGSTNGTWLVTASGRTSVDPSGTPWPDDAHLVVGATRLALRTCDACTDDTADGAHDDARGLASTVPDGLGHLLVNRAPRLRRPDRAEAVRWPEAPAEPTPGRLPWAALLVPAVLAVPMALLWHQPALLLLGLLSPLALLAQHLLERRGGRRTARRAAAEHADAVAAARAAFGTATAADLSALERDLPDLARIAAAAAGPTRLLWHRTARDDDAWLVRLGRGAAPVRVPVEGPDRPDDVPGVHPDAPVALDLAAVAVLGLAGPRDAVLGLARAVVAQVVTLRPPVEVRVGSRTDAVQANPWTWLEWLPHNASARPTPADEERLIVLDGAQSLRRDPAVADLLGRARARADETGPGPRPPRIVVLCLEDDPAGLPVECGATVTVDGHGRTLLRSADGEVPLAPDGAGPAWAARLARDLARLRDATPVGERAEGGSARLPALLGLPPVGAEPDALAWAEEVGRRWSAAVGPPRLEVVLGIGTEGPWRVDLRRDGPHALVAGTTGAGKSELLRSLVAALAVEYPPTQVALLLVDYKGGTAFAGLDRLPHVCGLLTDLDQHLARRALASLHAELRRRERLLRRHGAADLDAYDRLAVEREPVPRLVLVVDEFRTLADELPDLLAGLVRVAALGRSLGVHLVLATQRPAGAVTADMRANLNLRVALRVRDRADSEDVVEAPDAGALTADRPGAGFVRSGGGPLHPVRVALLTDPPRDDGRPRVTVLRAGPGPARTDPGAAATPAAGGPGAGGGDGPAEQEARRAAVERLVTACRRAAVDAGPVPAPPWLPPLPSVLRLEDLAAHAGASPSGRSTPPSTGATGPGTVTSRPAADGPSILLGLCDLPDEQRRAPLRWDLAAGHLGVIGGPGAGRTSTLRAVVAGLVAAGTHVHVLTGPAGLRVPPDLPGLGTVVPVSDTERTARLLRHLAREPLPGPWTVLVVDGWEAVVETLGGHDRGWTLDDLVTLVRDRGADGVRLAAAGGRSLLSGQFGALLGQRLLLRTADPTDLLVAGLRADEVPTAMPPGRCVVLSGVGRAAVEAQVVLVDEVMTTPPSTPPGTTHAPPVSTGPTARDGLTSRGTARPLRLLPLPTRVPLGSLPAGPGSADPHGVVIGLGGDGAQPVSLPLPPGGVVLVAGPPGSGRSTALAVVERQAMDAGRAVLRAGPGPMEAERTALTGPPPVVLLDDVDRAGPDVRAAVEALVADGATAVVGATPADAAVAYSGLLAAARTTACGLLLGPLGAGEGEVLGVRVTGTTRSAPPGRGLLAVRGGAVPVQVADPTDPRVTAVPDGGRERSVTQ